MGQCPRRPDPPCTPGGKESFEKGRGKRVDTASLCKQPFPEMMKALSWDQRKENKVRFNKTAPNFS